MDKISVLVSAPVDTYSGYGARSRDVVKALLALEKYDVKILSQRWGNTRFGYLKDHGENDMIDRIVAQPSGQPDIWIQISVPNEFQPIGKYNIGITAGIETTICHASWLDGCNRMNLILTSSQHSKNVFERTTFEKVNSRTNQNEGEIKCTTPVEVLIEGADLTKYFDKAGKTNSLDLDSIKEDFCYLFVGHWMQGEFGHDRKNVGYTIKAFLETFKNKMKQPALILKTQRVGGSIMDQQTILKDIDTIRKQTKGRLPNIYLLHGELHDDEINDLYNHRKVKAMVSFTKGEGFGRPLLEFSLTGKPIITSGWSGQIDFLDTKNAVLIGGELEKVHPSAAVKDMILPEASWFKPDDAQVNHALKEVFKNYKKYVQGAKRLKNINKKAFSFEKMVEDLGVFLSKYVPEFPKQVELKLPTFELPKLTKNG